MVKVKAIFILPILLFSAVSISSPWLLQPVSALSLTGTHGDDHLKGTNGQDYISGKGGDDLIRGLAGADNLFGGNGNDRLDGGRGNDKLSGGKGVDRLSGGPGDDILTGGLGADIFNCGQGNDIVQDFSKADGDKVFRNCEIVRTGLVAHWKLDEGTGATAADSSGNGNKGSLINDPSWLDESQCILGDSCLDLDGVDDYMSVTRSSSIEPSNAITITMWVSADVPRGALIDKAFTSHTYPFYSYNLQLEPKTADPTKAELVWGLATNEVVTFMGEGSTEVLIDLKSWQFVTVVYDGSHMKEYVNGELKASVPKSGTISYYDKPLLIGKYNNLEFFTNTAIDDVRMFNRALSDTEIQQLYEEFAPPSGPNVIGDGGFESGSVTVDASEPRGYWGSTGNRFNATPQVTTEDKHSGTYSLKITSSVPTAAYVYQYYALGTGTYSYSFWYRGTGNATGEVTTGWGPPPWFIGGPYNPQPGALISLGRGLFPMDGQWHKASVINTPSDQAWFLDGLQISCGTGNSITPTETLIGDLSELSENTSILFVDDVSLVSGQEYPISCP